MRTYIWRKQDKKKVIKDLKAASKKFDEILIATDPDREGEAIAANLVNLLEIQNKYKRIKYNEITETAIKNAIENPLLINQNLVNAQKTRRILDRIIGFRLSRIVDLKISQPPITPTAGRVQSVALKLIIDKEKERKSFVPIQYSTIKALQSDEIEFEYFNNIKPYQNNSLWIEPKEAEAIIKELKGDLVVKNIKVSEKKEAKVTPFKQSVLYKRAGISSGAVQASLQSLYEGYGSGGLISYPRTDSTRLSKTFLEHAQQFIVKNFGQEYVAKDIKGFAGDQDAHEAIRPTDLNLTPDKAKEMFELKEIDYKIYSLIYQNSLQATMNVPIRKTVRYELENNNHSFKATESDIIFDGYYKIMPDKLNKEKKLNLKLNDVVPIKEYKLINSETQPPSRYSEGSLIEAMDEIKVGRPSTFATIIKTLKERLYVENGEKTLIPSDFGSIVLEKLFEISPEIINEKYTSSIEEKLDLIAEGTEDYKKVLDIFWEDFQKNVETTTENITRTSAIQKVDEMCPEDNVDLIFRFNKATRQKFIGCSNFPKCKFVKSLPNSSQSYKKKYVNWSKKKQ
ncbi:type I DNA topoisomerase [Mesomycoplasma neurolyticum]|uniref:DNA topoisomerase n=1 Tax=Mesomycoplasma neurolyticum TaxID=2120 RepID=A0A449A6I0_9BACT|nr:type I DNA topoisomerase [Mesomycoplasma neurolyticum]VEU59865.1 DNA topoisomerase 1 [Mesomycoplasma neurolyticum]